MRRVFTSVLAVAVLAFPRVSHAYYTEDVEAPTVSPQEAVASLRTALRHADVDVSLCALEHPEDAARLATREGTSLDARVVVSPSGAWHLTLGDEAPVDQEPTPLATCIQSALATQVGSSFLLARPLSRTTEVRRRFVLSRPASPSQTTRIERAIARRSAAFEACLEGVESAVQVHYETMPHGFIHVVNADGLPEARFSERIACLQQVASALHGIPRHVVFRGTLSIMPAVE